MKTPCTRQRSDLHRLARFEDQRHRQPVGRVADDEARSGQHPAGGIGDPDEHLDHTEEPAEPEAGALDELELRPGDLHHHATQKRPILRHRFAHDGVDVDEVAGLAAHALEDLLRHAAHVAPDEVVDVAAQLLPRAFPLVGRQIGRELVDDLLRDVFDDSLDRLVVVVGDVREDLLDVEELVVDELAEVPSQIVGILRHDALPAQQRGMPTNSTG